MIKIYDFDTFALENNMEQFFCFFIDYLIIIDYVALNEDPRLIAMIIGNYFCDPNIKNAHNLATCNSNMFCTHN